MTNEIRNFNCGEGISFTRLDNGDVRFSKRERDGGITEMVFDEAEWVSIVANMSRSGDCHNEILELHSK